MKIRRAAIRVYLTAATSMATEMNKSCNRTWTLAHVRRPVNPTARMLLGSGFKNSSPHLMLLNIDRSFSFSEPSLSSGPNPPLFLPFSSLPLGSFLNSLLLLLLLLLSSSLLASVKNLVGLLRIGAQDLRNWKRKRRWIFFGGLERGLGVEDDGRRVMGCKWAVRPIMLSCSWRLDFPRKVREENLRFQDWV